jgi:hypothetical protein
MLRSGISYVQKIEAHGFQRMHGVAQPKMSVVEFAGRGEQRLLLEVLANAVNGVCQGGCSRGNNVASAAVGKLVDTIGRS